MNIVHNLLYLTIISMKLDCIYMIIKNLITKHSTKSIFR